jgi:hypothetical protein
MRLIERMGQESAFAPEPLSSKFEIQNPKQPGKIKKQVSNDLSF